MSATIGLFPTFASFQSNSFTKPIVLSNIGSAARVSMKPLFSDNSLVFYKPHSLTGVGTVRNASHKARTT